ncbi:hypothetical protein F6U93_06200 [Tamlana haliotis]|uniref:Uncharacterized protein n=1 Tax=Pseudotamlana haliotis TaxID=2614804 RepID=A0A6N6MFH9_9FLAO|nr:hypothetical protein [Tamlana haliotis]KAB1068518.1 hypothetical protein F6U93_06200 [Tamlana haliotis]
MRIFIITFLVISQSLFSQETEKKTYNIGVVKPTKAEIEKSLGVYKDTIELAYKNQYYSYRERLKEIIETKADFYPEDMRDDFEKSKINAKAELKEMDSLKSQFLSFKYQELISYYSTSILNMAFNEYEPYSSIYEIRNSEIKTNGIFDYAENNNLDFIVTFENIKAYEKNENFEMSITLKLYSREEKKIIVEKEIYGNTNSYGGMWTCGNPLTCLFITSVKETIGILVPKIKQLN